MVKIRLKRIGRKKHPVYRVVVADSRSPRDGRNIEAIGTYSPLQNKEITLNMERYKYWIEKGAQPTKTVTKIIHRKEAETNK